jgi:hypothetical protein
MFTDDLSEVERLERKLIATINDKTEGYGFENTLTALVHAFTFQMALACPGCRKNIARALRKGVPEMLATANRLAAEAGPREDQHLH